MAIGLPLGRMGCRLHVMRGIVVGLVGLSLGTFAQLAGQESAGVSVRLEVHNGPQDDRYEAVSATGACRLLSGKPDTLVASFRPDFPSNLTWVALLVPDPSGAAEIGTDRFYLQFDVVTIPSGKVRYAVEARAGHQRSGQGSIRLSLSDPQVIARFSAETMGGIRLSGSVTCGDLVRGGVH